MFIAILFLSLFSVSRCFSLAVKEPLVTQSVNTSNGLIIGHPARNRSDVIEYLGIPYAQPPLGQLRFDAPQPYNQTGTYNASNYSPGCPFTQPTNFTYPNATPQEPRIVDAFNTALGETLGEDCLTLNIWAKAGNDSPRPVLVFFYGGSKSPPQAFPHTSQQLTPFLPPLEFDFGGTNTPFYNGQYLASAEDVLVITLNYRLNIFGFSGAPGLPQNVGLLDQRLAVEWIRANAASFGGNASAITLFGQSAGSAAVDFWAYAYPHDPIAHALISQSGVATSFPANTAEIAQAHWYNASARLGCGGAGDDTVACMRSKNWTEVEAAGHAVAGAAPPIPGRTEPPFQPSPDNVTVFADYPERSARGQFAKVPYLAGNNNNEAAYYQIAAYDAGTILTEEQWQTFILYDFTCPIGSEMRNRTKAGVPAWRFRYFGDWDNLRLFPGSGAYHGSDLEMVFGASQDVTGLPESAPEMQMQRLFMKAWATFAKDPVNGLVDVLGWPKYDPNSPTLIRLGYNNTPTAEFVDPQLYDSPCAALNQTS
ncbi:MAG: hypothetical protein M1822_003751 [Bathelium mastoideum]|nr:MAG: hypothetical protein M1822_003751 [Bathelium mastoideum]